MTRNELLAAYEAGGRGFCEANLSEADLSKANLSGADMRCANLSGANLSKANLSKADLSEADLRRADLSGANLRWANLRWADLRWADLRWADLRRANLSEANLRWADLSGARLNWIAAQGAHWPVGQEIYSVYGIGTLRVVHYRPSTDTVWAGCWTGSLVELEAELPLVISKCVDSGLAKIEYDAMMAYFKALMKVKP